MRKLREKDGELQWGWGRRWRTVARIDERARGGGIFLQLLALIGPILWQAIQAWIKKKTETTNQTVNMDYSALPTCAADVECAEE
jgi:hypothetical protein